MKVSRSFRQIIISQLGFTTVTNRTQQLPNKFQTHLGANSSSNNVIKSTPSSELTPKSARLWSFILQLVKISKAYDLVILDHLVDAKQISNSSQGKQQFQRCHKVNTII